MTLWKSHHLVHRKKYQIRRGNDDNIRTIQANFVIERTPRWLFVGQRVKFPVRLFSANQIAQKIQNLTVPDVLASIARNAWQKSVSAQIPLQIYPRYDGACRLRRSRTIFFISKFNYKLWKGLSESAYPMNPWIALDCLIYSLIFSLEIVGIFRQESEYRKIPVIRPLAYMKPLRL